jgi:hypothetical protein
MPEQRLERDGKKTKEREQRWESRGERAEVGVEVKAP